MTSIWISVSVLSVSLLIKLIHGYLTNRENKKSDEMMNYQRKLQAKKLYEEREERTDLSEMAEEEFWEIMDAVHKRSKKSFKNSIGVFNDLIKKYSPEELIQLDNLLIRLFKENVNQDIYAASRIIFHVDDLGATLVLMNLLMTRGEVFFKQACQNPNLIIGKEFTDIEGRVFQNVVADRYFSETLKLIPEIVLDENEEPLEIPGEKWTEKDLPTRYQELWFHYY